MAGEARAMKLDPYRNFRFKVKIGGQFVLGVNKMSGLKKTTEGIDWSQGGDNANFEPQRLPGKTKYEAITLEQGMTESKVFEDWANKMNKYSGNKMADDFRQNIELHLCDHNGETLTSYKIFDCWVSEYQAVPALDLSQNGVAIRSVKLEHEGFERDK